MTPGIGLTSIGIVGIGISLSGIAKTFIEGMHAVALLTMFIGMILLASGLFKDGFPTSGRAKSATFITLGFLVTFGFAAAVTVSTQVPSIYAYIGLMLIISIPATVLTVASYRGVQYLKPIAAIFIGAAIVGGITYYAFGLVTPKPPAPEQEQGKTSGQSQGPSSSAAAAAPRPANTINARILPGASAQGNPDYDPDPISVKKGDGVEWTNQDNVPHTVTSKQAGAFDSSIINAGAKWLLNTARLQPAQYEYYCSIHPFMGAKLVVTNGAAATPGQSSGNTTTMAQAGTSNNQSRAAANGTAGNTTATAGNAASPKAPLATGGSVTSVSIVVGASVPTNGEFFSPNNVQTTVGSMVTWKNDDSASHTVTSGLVQANKPTPDGRFDSSVINAGQSFRFVFDKAGEYPYYCSIHPWMAGKVTVK
jgi:plastocyanin